MSKGAGTTRGGKTSQTTINERLTAGGLAVEYIKNSLGATGDITNEMMDAWDRLTWAQKLSALERSGVDGLINTDEFEFYASVYKEVSRQEMVETVGDVLSNVKDGHDMEDENHYIIGLKNGGRIWTERLSADDIGGKWNQPSVRGSDGKFYDLSKGNVTYISANSGMSNYSYWAKDAKALADLKAIGFDQVKKGRIQ